MKKLYLIAISHFDPLMRSLLRDCLRELNKENGTDPVFVGVEWKEQWFNSVKDQRDYFERQIESLSPNLNPKELKKLVLSLGYEGDTHRDVFPNVNTVWLDNERDDKDNAVLLNYANDRLKIYSNFLNEDWTQNNILDNLSKIAREREKESLNSAPSIDDRDRKWADLIKKKFDTQEDSSWAIVICGESHTLLTKQDSFADRMQKMLVCEVIPKIL